MLRALFSFHDRYRILHLTWLAFFLSFVVWFSFAPFATPIGREFHLTAPKLKVLAICNLALTIPARIVIGMVLDRYGPQLTFSGLLIFAVVPCLTTATAHDFNQLVWSSLINSILGAGFVVGVRMVAEWFPSQPTEWIVDVSAQSESYFLRNQIAKAFGAKPASVCQAVVAFFKSEAQNQNAQLMAATEAIVRQSYTQG